MEWALLPLRRYLDFEGRSRRLEFWSYALFCLIVYVTLAAVTLAGLPWGSGGDKPGALFWIGGALIVIFYLGNFIPGIAVRVRRFHDLDMSGWFYLFSFIPYIGWLIVLVFMCIDGTKGPNRFGDSPKHSNAALIFE